MDPGAPLPPLTLAEYMNSQLFPLTSQPGLSPHDQMMIDAVNYDEFKEDSEGGALLTDEEQRIGAELKRKHDSRESVLAELKRASHGPGTPP